MKKIFILSYCLFLIAGIVLPGHSFSQNVGIGTTTPQASAKLDVTSTNSGFLPPRMTSAQRDAIVNPTPGLIIFNTTTNSIELFTKGWGTLSFESPSVKKLFGGSALDESYGIFQTNDGGFIVAGFSASSNTGTLTGLTNNGGTYDGWIQKLDSKGTLQWQKLFGGNGFDAFVTVQPTSDGGYIAVGYSNSSNTGTLTGVTNNGGHDYWVLKMDANGTMIWQKLLGGSGEENTFAIQQTTDGGYIIAGYSTSSNSGTLTGLFNYGGIDYWIVKLNGSGTLQWQRLWGGTLNDQAFSIDQTTDGGYIVTGLSNSSNTGVLAGLFSNGGYDYWIVKLNSAGTLQWQKLFGGSSDDVDNKIRQTADGGFIIAGHTSSSNTGTLTGLTNNGFYDYWIIKLDGSGNLQWQKLYGGSLYDYLHSVQQTTDGGFIVGGYSSSSNTGTLTGLTNSGAADLWILKLDGSGNITWQKLLGGSNNDHARNVQQTTDGGYIVAGSTGSSDTGALTGLINNGAYDSWILKLDKYGNPF